MSVFRTKCISTKVTNEEYARLEALAGDQTISEWARAVLLNAAAPPSEPILLAELLALRTIVVNLLFDFCRGEPIAAETVRLLIDCADHDKAQQARERLASAGARSEP